MAARMACSTPRRCSPTSSRHPVKIVNPADGALLREVADDNAAAVASKYARARAAQPAWAAAPLDVRLGAAEKFKALVERRKDALARTLTSETGKPIAQARNELNALAAPIDFFLAN